MTDKKIRTIGAAILLALWLCLTLVAWFSPAQSTSEAERRPLAQFPELSTDTVLAGKFMTKFEDYTLDQFPLRDSFRQLKSLFHYYLLGQKDNNGIYLSQGYAAKMEYPLNPDSLDHALSRFQYVYDTYLKETGSQVYTCVVPDKSYYLAQESGVLSMDYATLFQTMAAGMPYATYVDITDTLNYTSYYRTDTHWRQEHLLATAQKLTQAMGVTAPQAEDYTQEKLERPFYGVYYGQAALPMDPEDLYILRSDLLEQCIVTNHETGKTAQVYDMEMVNEPDLYEVFLSGPVSLLTVENPNATSDKELIIFRDSFGSAITPLLLQGYRTVTLVDIRYLPTTNVGRFVDFHGQDVLFLYSTLVLNNSETIN